MGTPPCVKGCHTEAMIGNLPVGVTDDEAGVRLLELTSGGGKLGSGRGLRPPVA
jgi:hypothetical protein